jgi:hypothetical protein
MSSFNPFSKGEGSKSTVDGQKKNDDSKTITEEGQDQNPDNKPKNDQKEEEGKSEIC